MDYIRSKDYQKFIEENGVIVSDWDKVTLIYHAPGMSHTEKIFALLELKKRTEDPNLQRQITERLDRDHRFYEAYKQCNGNAYYKLSVPYEGRYSTEGIYLSFEAAYLDGKKEGNLFRIEKALFACKKQAGDTNGVFGAVEFDEQGYLHKILWLHEKNEGLDFEQNETGVKIALKTGMWICRYCTDREILYISWAQTCLELWMARRMMQRKKNIAIWLEKATIQISRLQSILCLTGISICPFFRMSMSALQSWNMRHLMKVIHEKDSWNTSNRCCMNVNRIHFSQVQEESRNESGRFLQN